jgi:toxin ParE1/3/4
MGVVTKTAQAEADMEAIWLHIALDSPSAADWMLDAFAATAHTLADQPHLGRARFDLLADLAPDLRSFPVKSYILFYRPVAPGIEIVRVLHSARDIKTVLNE